jgi:oligopeptide/dipeptide ABC transporter ATP-binding protein
VSSLLEIEGLVVEFSVGAGLRRKQKLRAVDGVDLSVESGAVLGVVGESGCGKSTLARAVVGLVPVTAGAMRYDGRPLGDDRSLEDRRHIQMVFQDHSASLNARMTVGQMLKEMLRVHRMVAPDRIEDRCAELMDLVGLSAGLLGSRPRALSGGQRQRVAIARALALEPRILIADEAVAALDVSVQAAVLSLLADLRDRLDLTIVFISHDLAVVRNLCDRVAVMYLGRIVEESSTDTIFGNPGHPYSQALLHAAPDIAVLGRSERAALGGEPPSPLSVPTGCRFHPRCPIAQTICESQDPVMTVTGDHDVACHFAWTGPDLTLLSD